MRAEPKPEDFTAIVDTAEQVPFTLLPLKKKRKKLVTGDYSVEGLETVVSVERKSLPDLIGCIGGERRRFERELERLHAYPAKMVVVEASWTDLEVKSWRGNVTPKQALGTVLGWIRDGVPFLFAGSAGQADIATARFLFISARERYREAYRFMKGQKIDSRE